MGYLKYGLACAIALLMACATGQKPVDFEFYDASGQGYDSQTFSSQMQERYNLAQGMRMVVVATQSSADSHFTAQLDVLEAVDAESLHLAYILANAEGKLDGGYHTNPEAAATLLDGQSFRIMVLDGFGNLILSGDGVLSEAEIKAALNE